LFGSGFKNFGTGTESESEKVTLATSAVQRKNNVYFLVKIDIRNSSGKFYFLHANRRTTSNASNELPAVVCTPRYSLFTIAYL